MVATSNAAFPFPTAERHDPPEMQPVRPVERAPDEAAVDHGIEESFPASDPVSVNVTRVEPTPPKCVTEAGEQGAPRRSRLRKALRAGLVAGALTGAAVGCALAGRTLRMRGR